MHRRRFLATSAAAIGAGVSFAGCLGFGGSESPPPRRSNVFEQVASTDGTLNVQFVDDPTVHSRADVSGDLAGVSPVGVARAGGRGGRGGRGATGRGSRSSWSSAPKTRHGYAYLHADDDDDDWREAHADEITKYGVVVAAAGVAYLGREATYEDNPPGPGPVGWDKNIDDPSGTVTYSDTREGWHRAGAHLVAENGNHDFGWAALDFQLDEGTDGYRVEEPWKVSPSL